MAYPLRLRGVWLAIGWLLIALVIGLSLMPSPPEIPGDDKLTHLLVYAVLMVWFGQLYRRPQVRVAYALALVVLGLALEFTQGVGGYRWFEWADAVANAAGVLLALLALNRGADGLLSWWERHVMRLPPTRSERRESP